MPIFNETFTDPTLANWNRQFYTGWYSNTDPSASSKTLAANKEAECYTDDSVSVANGILSLTATKGKPNILNYPWVSGMIAQKMELAITYGYFEATCKLPAGGGLWPAFWMLGTDITVWPPELDIFEILSSNTKLMYCSAHSKDKTYVDNLNNIAIQDASKDFHRYGVLWKSDTITWYYDGKPVVSQPTPSDMHGPMYMILNLAVGGQGSWPGVPDPTLTTAVMQVSSVSSHPIGSWTNTDIPTQPVGNTMLTSTDVDAILNEVRNTLNKYLPPSTLYITLSGTPYLGNPHALITVDGVATDIEVAGTVSAPTVYKTNVTKGKHTVTVTFTNDAWGGSADKDRNLYLANYYVDSGTPIVLAKPLNSQGDATSWTFTA